MTIEEMVSEKLRGLPPEKQKEVLQFRESLKPEGGTTPVESFRWLHLTDLHIGADRRLWPGVREAFFADLLRLHKVCGPWDLILLSGDLAYSGCEFEEVDKLLDELLDRLNGISGPVQPAVLAVPGNHDLSRPPAGNAYAELLSEYYSRESVRQWFWNKDNDYWKTAAQSFAKYQNWWLRRRPKEGPFREGLLPGDFSFSLAKNGVSLGIVGLNTTFLQLKAGDYYGKLAIDVEQFHAVCDGDGPRWTGERDACILLTHHPQEWLCQPALEQLKSEIYPPTRFAVQLCGHMHRPLMQSVSVGGAPPRRVWQGCSLFGIEHWEDSNGKKQERLHGYAAGRIDITGAGSHIRHWPRRAYLLQAGYRRIGPDQEVVLLQDEGTAPEQVARAHKNGSQRPPQPLLSNPPPLIVNTMPVQGCHPSQPVAPVRFAARPTHYPDTEIKSLLAKARREIGDGHVHEGLTAEQAAHIAAIMTSGIFGNVKTSAEARSAMEADLLKTYPRKEVRYVPSFTLLQWPVTVGMFRLFVESRDYKTRAEVENQSKTWRSVDIDARKDHPVTFISFGDALDFCSWVHDVCGWQNVRLPKSLEYEYVVRGGETDRLFPWGNHWEYERCNDIFWGGDKTTSRVTQFENGRAMPQDVWDLCGNVYEWLWDPPEKGFRAIAGGSFKHSALWTGHASARARCAEYEASDEIGFRIVIKE